MSERSQAIEPLWVGLFVVSGATGLGWQVVWARELHLVFGTSTFAISTVLAAFMAGLGLGGWAGGRLASATRRPGAWYGVLEGGVALWALAVPWLIAEVAGPVGAGGPLVGMRAWATALAAGAVVVPPTMAMGATLPLLVAATSPEGHGAAWGVGRLVAANGVGAVLGAVLTGFFLLPALGVQQTTFLMVATHLVLALVAVRLGRGSLPVAAPARIRLGVWGLAAAMGGAAGLVHEVAWTRALSLVLGPSVYAFTIVLATWLIGLAVGGAVGARTGDAFDERTAARAWAAAQLGVGAVSVGMLMVARELPFWFVYGFDALGAWRDPGLLWALSLAISGLVLLPPAMLSGMAFPWAVRAVSRGEPGGLAAAAGAVSAAASAGGAVGAFAGGFLALPHLHVRGTLLAAACLGGVAGALVLAARRERRAAGGALAGTVAVLLLAPAWDARTMTAGTYHYVMRFADHSREGIRDSAVGDYDLLFYDEGPTSVVTVGRNPRTGNIWLANHGKIDASTHGDLATQILVGLLPFQYSEGHDALVIGLASGITAGAVSRVEGVRDLEIVEIEPAVIQAARFFDEANHHVLDDPRVTMIADDGRHHVLTAPVGRWDVVVSEPSNPWISGVSNLFTEDFLRMGRTKLKPGGVWAQWMQVYGLSMEDLRVMLATFDAVFPYSAVYVSADLADLVLLGSDRPLRASFGASERLFGSERTAAELRRAGVDDAVELVGLRLFDGDGLDRLTAGVPHNTDDNLWIEFRAPLHLHADNITRNLAMLARAMEVPDIGDATGPSWGALAETYAEWGQYGRAAVAMRRAEEAFPEGSPQREVARAAAVTLAEEAQRHPAVDPGSK